MNKDYLGDSVYAELNDHGDVVLTTDNGDGSPSNIIFMEPSVVAALERFLARVKERET